MTRILVYQQKGKLRPAGGASAVCYYYMKEQERRGDSYFEFLPDFTSFSKLHDNEKTRISKMPKWIQKSYSIFKQIVRLNIILGGHYKTEPVDFSKYDIVHFHDTQNLYIRRKDLLSYKGVIILQSHEPCPLAKEIYDSLTPFVRFFIPFIKKRLETMDRFAFQRADYIIFPCPEAEEPYYNNWRFYKTIHESKKESYRYVLTGIPASKPRISREEIRRMLCVPDQGFVVCYVGRHNIIKGYDSLKRIGSHLLSKADTWVVCAGKEYPLTGLDNSHWIEIGWTTDAHSYISGSDVFLLPNKETYFDIVMLEVLSLGKVVVARRTGGNKYFEKMGCKGVFLYDTEEEALSILEELKMLSKEELSSLGQQNKAFFEKHHTVEVMYDNYINTLKELHTIL